MLKLDAGDIKGLVTLLTPLMQTEESRRALLLSALGSNRLIDNLSLSGRSSVAIPLLLSDLAAYGVLPNEKEEALIILLEHIRESELVGQDVQNYIAGLTLKLRQKNPTNRRLKEEPSQLLRDTTRIQNSNAASESTRLVADVLLICVTKVEVQAVLDCVREKFGREASEHFTEQSTLYDLGEIGGARTFMMRSEMGAGGPSGALLTISQGIEQLKPTSVIMVGIAFGVDPDKQEIGEILVSKQLLDYELQRIGTDSAGGVTIIPRGDRPSASPRLLPRFRAGEIRWKDSKVDFGLILSGDKLVDNIDYREQLRQLEPEAIGGEMEGAGLYAAAYNRQVDWILVKAICDWADGKKRENKTENQKKAADNAASFTLEVIRQGGFGKFGGTDYPSQNPVKPNDSVGESGRTDYPSQNPVTSNQKKAADNAASFTLEVIRQGDFGKFGGTDYPSQNPVKPNDSVGESGRTDYPSQNPVTSTSKNVLGFDVFLCHNSQDKPAVKQIGKDLQAQGLKPWLDEWELIPGRSWQELVEKQIKQIKSAAVFVGATGSGPWQAREIRALLKQFVDRDCPVIPVLLPSAPQEPDLPLFMQDLGWVDFRRLETEPMKRLIWGITGQKTD